APQEIGRDRGADVDDLYGGDQRGRREEEVDAPGDRPRQAGARRDGALERARDGRRQERGVAPRTLGPGDGEGGSDADVAAHAERDADADRAEPVAQRRKRERL